MGEDAGSRTHVRGRRRRILGRRAGGRAGGREGSRWGRWRRWEAVGGRVGQQGFDTLGGAVHDTQSSTAKTGALCMAAHGSGVGACGVTTATTPPPEAGALKS